jgi:hypothetical protein
LAIERVQGAQGRSQGFALEVGQGFDRAVVLDHHIVIQQEVGVGVVNARALDALLRNTHARQNDVPAVGFEARNHGGPLGDHVVPFGDAQALDELLEQLGLKALVFAGLLVFPDVGLGAHQAHSGLQNALGLDGG